LSEREWETGRVCDVLGGGQEEEECEWIEDRNEGSSHGNKGSNLGLIHRGEVERSKRNTEQED
jgi:hypothetical protein